LSNFISSGHDRLRKVSIGWWLRFGKSPLILSISSLLLYQNLSLGIFFRFCFTVLLEATDEEEEELVSVSLDSDEDDGNLPTLPEAENKSIL